ncbi:lanthionine synthetase C family protein [Nonomuraea sp. NN258]|uniref:lanthionine synthetase C family protein n=1 Tax=Nonomuraea antri TaxID=2730852 RepID=UPI001568AAAB|nr:lanthionine synthetase C family protein [Nonomuraea antri]NRQ30667.1 lanthionine synthetase C family protein [Nonomuraea antri]
MTGPHPAIQLAVAVADRTATPSAAPTGLTSRPWWRQSLAHGAPGLALLHIELAAAGLRPWQPVHEWLTYITSEPVTSGPDSHLYYGTPAVAHAIACAADHLPGYERALQSLDQTITADTQYRLDAAHARIDAGRLPDLAEFDVIRGLTGLGAYLLRRDPDGKTLHAVLEYLVRLTEPIQDASEALPGWWTLASPDGRPHPDFPGGHGNFGLAHGISGPLALLALAARRGVTASGHLKAMLRICQWFDRWREDTREGFRWPYLIKRAHLHAGREPLGPQRPSWCYGTAGLVRTQQLAALAMGDAKRLNLAGHALTQAIGDPAQRTATTDLSLCHGFAGIAHLATRVIVDAYPDTSAQLHTFLPVLLDEVLPSGADPNDVTTALLGGQGGPSLLEGAAGIALAVLAPATGSAPSSGWDTCLLIATSKD